MSEEREILTHELLGDHSTRPCAICEMPKPTSGLVLVSGETIGHPGGGNVDVCVDCYQTLQSGEIEPPGDPDF
jgi:hypothetical protein